MIMIFLRNLIILSTFAVVTCSDICYDGLGCFTTDDPFGGTNARPLSFLPDKPSSINTKFFLYTPTTKDNGQEINWSDDNNGTFMKELPVKFIVHGFFNTPSFNKWPRDLKDEFLKKESCNVIIVDWGGGSFNLYTQATANTQVVGAEIARLAKALIQKRGIDASSFHCIGHSLGAHACGYAGDRVKGMGRITGMDPAGPYFENTPPIVRLDPGDATFVDILHTSAMKLLANTTGIGILSPIGHVDFYPNGGLTQPGCSITEGNVKPQCSHASSVYYFKSSINSKCPFTAFPCSSYEEFQKGNCLQCSQNGCNTMGYQASQNTDQKSLYLDTGYAWSDPICYHYYQIIMTSDDVGDNLAKGSFSIYFDTGSEKSSTELIDDGGIIFSANSVEKKLVSIDSHLKSDIVKVYITYQRGWNPVDYWYYESTWMFKTVEVFSAEHQTSVKLCPVDPFLGISANVEYEKC